MALLRRCCLQAVVCAGRRGSTGAATVLLLLLLLLLLLPLLLLLMMMCTMCAQYALPHNTLQVRGMFTSIVDPSSAAFRSIRAGVGAALAAHLLYGRSALSGNTGAASACSAALGRVGAAALADDIADLGERLANVAAVQEAVNGHMLRVLLLTDGANQATSHT